MDAAQLCYADYVVVNVLLWPWLWGTAKYYVVKLSFIGISLLAMCSHARTMLTNPGAVPMEYQPNNLLSQEQGDKIPMCSRCNGFKPPRAHHCSQCDRCIVKMDHHCPWVNNCVGMNNQKHFVLFVFYTATLSAYALLLLLLRAFDNVGTLGVASVRYHRVQGDDRLHAVAPNSADSSRFLLMALLFLEAVLFGLFTLAVSAMPGHVAFAVMLKEDACLSTVPMRNTSISSTSRMFSHLPKRCSVGLLDTPDLIPCACCASQMLTEQVSSIISDQTGIERLKHLSGPPSRSWLHNMSETFGRPVSVVS